MLTPTGFESYKEYFQFVLAREYRDAHTNEKFEYPKSRLEILGDWLSKPAIGLTDRAILNIRNPLMITALAVVAIGITTLIFYPDQVVQHITRTIPITKKIEPWMIKGVMYLIACTTIFGLGLRADQRLANLTLRNNWDQTPRKIVPISIGTVRVKRT